MTQNKLGKCEILLMFSIAEPLARVGKINMQLSCIYQTLKFTFVCKEDRSMRKGEREMDERMRE